MQRHNMNKKIVTLILVILVSFSFLSIVMADNVTNNDTNTTDHDKIDNDKDVDNNKQVDKKTDDKKTTDKSKTNDKSNKNYIKAKGSGNEITFSDGFKGFRLDYSKSPASTGDEFKHAPTSKVSNSNSLKQSIIKSYIDDSDDKIGKTISNALKSNSSNVKTGSAAIPEKVGDHEVVRINKNTEAVFDFEVLKSVSGNESDYFAYKVSFRTIDDGENINETNNITKVANTTNVTNTTNITNATNITNNTNITNLTMPVDNETNATFLQALYDYLAFLADALYNVWKPIFDTLINNFLMIVTALEELANLYENFIMELQSLMDAIEELINMLESIWKELAGLLKLLDMILKLLQQLLNLIGAILSFIMAIIFAIIGLIQQLLALLFILLQFLADLINQIIALIQAILDFLKSIGSYLMNVIANGVIIIATFVVIAIGALIYNRVR